MAKFALAPDERKLSEHLITLVQGPKETYAAKLILTDQRGVVVIESNNKRGGLESLGIIGGVLKELFNSDRGKQTHQILKDRFASVEEGDGKMIIFHDTGEGYGHVWFAIKSKESFQIWKERMHHWASGMNEGAAALPSARVVDRDREG